MVLRSVRGPLAASSVALLLVLAGCGGGSKGTESTSTGTGSGKAVAADAVVDTSEGSFTIKLDVEHSPNTVASFEKLSRDGFYDGLLFHRIVPGFVIQGGDPNGDGTGGPGYSVTKAPPAGYAYKLGDVAMAKTQDEPPGAAGSQFFVISGPDGEQLPPDYGVAGHASDAASKATIRRIARLAVTDGPPSQPVYIISAKLVLK